MKEAKVNTGTTVSIVDSPIPTPGPHQILTKVIYSGCNPKDWKRAEAFPDKHPFNQGDDIAGIVHAVGSAVSEFKPGDRVMAIHEMMSPGGSRAEYALSDAHATTYLPNHTPSEQGAAIPLAALTAAVGLDARLGLPQPWLPVKDDAKIPLVVYGASSAVGSYAGQFAQESNIHPLICVAGRARTHVRRLLSPDRGDAIIDYRDGDEAVVRGIRAALKAETLEYAFDAVSEKNSYVNIGKVLDPHTGRITNVLPGKKYEGLPEGVTKTLTTVGSVHGVPDDLKEFGYVYFRYVSEGLEEGWFKAQTPEVVLGGLAGIETGLFKLKDGCVSAVKYVYKIADTPGVSQ